VGNILLVVDTVILAVVEQDLQLIFRLQELCADYGLKLCITRSTEEAVLYLRGVGIYANRTSHPLPGMVLLDTDSCSAADLKLLEWLRDHTEFRSTPVGMLADEPPHKVHVACALDPECFIIDRKSLWELPSVAWQVFFPFRPENPLNPSVRPVQLLTA
jgi:hypothetical protein